MIIRTHISTYFIPYYTMISLIIPSTYSVMKAQVYHFSKSGGREPILLNLSNSLEVYKLGRNRMSRIRSVLQIEWFFMFCQRVTPYKSYCMDS